MGLEESVSQIAVFEEALLALHTISAIFAIFEKSLLSQFLSIIAETW